MNPRERAAVRAALPSHSSTGPQWNIERRNQWLPSRKVWISNKQISRTSPNGCNHHENDLPDYRDPYEDMVRDHLDKVEKQKEERRKQNQDLELQRQQDQENEIELSRRNEVTPTPPPPHYNQKNRGHVQTNVELTNFFVQVNKKKLLSDMAEVERGNNDKFIELQKQKEEERSVLNKRMMEAENQSDEVIARLMVDGARLSDPAKVITGSTTGSVNRPMLMACVVQVMAAMEADKLAMEKQFTIVQVSYPKPLLLPTFLSIV